MNALKRWNYFLLTKRKVFDLGSHHLHKKIKCVCTDFVLQHEKKELGKIENEQRILKRLEN